MPLSKNYRWEIQDSSQHSLKERLLKIRHITPDKEDSFFHPHIDHLADPFLFRDMEKAVRRIYKAIEQKERIIVFGDYDVDGVTGTAILIRTLLTLKAYISYRLPHRIHDGYGLKKHIVTEMAEKGVTLLITVDNGIAAHQELSYAKEQGIDVIITDHHTVPTTVPEAFAIIHPQQENESYPFKELSGSGVAYVLARALLQYSKNPDHAYFWESMIDIAMLGTIADCVPLVGENRTIAALGLQQLPNTNHPGLQFLMQLTDVDLKRIDTHTVGFVLGPRINAGGRMDTALEALHLFLFSEEKSKEIAEKLHRLNTQRQAETEKITKAAELHIQQNPSSGIIVVAGDWHLGVIGIVASRLAEKYNVPAFVLGKKGKHYVASCRSEGQTNIIQIVQQYADYFTHFGGHAGAAGFEIEEERYNDFQQAIFSEFQTKKVEHLTPILKIDTLLEATDITWETYDLISSFAPFGQQNEMPLFMIKEMHIKNISFVGKDKNHLKLVLEKDGLIIDGIAFKQAHTHSLSLHDTIDIACHLEKNEFNGSKKLQLLIKDIQTT